MSNLNTFIKDSITEFGRASDPLSLPGEFEANSTWSPNDFLGSLAPSVAQFQIAGKIYDVEFSGLSNLGSKSAQTLVKSDIATKTISIDMIIPSARVSGKYKLAIAIGSDVSLTAAGEWFISGIKVPNTYCAVHAWPFTNGGNDTDIISLKEDTHAQMQLKLFRSGDFLGTKFGRPTPSTYSEFDIVFKGLFSGQVGQGVSEQMKTMTLGVLCKTILSQLEPVLCTRLKDAMRRHLQSDFNKVGFFEIMSGHVIPPSAEPQPVPNLDSESPASLALGLEMCEDDLSKMELKQEAESESEFTPVSVSATATGSISAQKRLEGLTTSPADVSEVVLATSTAHTADGIVIKIVTEKTVVLKYQ